MQTLRPWWRRGQGHQAPCCYHLGLVCVLLSSFWESKNNSISKSWDFPGKNTGVGCHFLLQGDLPDPEIEPASPALAGGFFTTGPPGKPPDLPSRPGRSNRRPGRCNCFQGGLPDLRTRLRKTHSWQAHPTASKVKVTAFGVLLRSQEPGNPEWGGGWNHRNTQNWHGNPWLGYRSHSPCAQRACGKNWTW